jgi:hypothetical protein
MEHLKYLNWEKPGLELYLDWLDRLAGGVGAC